jgi:Rrf2 family nitric oxide-sensitive transcriptional repressor
MNLKMQTDYALRTLIYLAHVPGQASVQQVADTYRISRDHLFKVVQHLVRLGYVVSRPGRSGGIRLAKDPAQINCGVVAAEFEGRNGLLPCVKDSAYCVLEAGCVLRVALIKAENAMYAELEKLTLAELVQEHRRRRPAGGAYQLFVRGAAMSENDSAG